MGPPAAGANGFIAKSFKIVPNIVGFQSSTVQTLLERASSTLKGALAAMLGIRRRTCDTPEGGRG